MNNDQLAALLNSFKTEILEKIDALEAKLPASVLVPPAPGTQASIWSPLSLDDPLAEVEETAAGWIGRDYMYSEFPGDFQMLEACWAGVEPPTGVVMHHGNAADMDRKRKEVLALHAIDVAGNWGLTVWGCPEVNTTPAAAACFILLDMARSSEGLSSGSQFSPMAFNNITSLEAAYERMKYKGGAPSGGQ